MYSPSWTVECWIWLKWVGSSLACDLLFPLDSIRIITLWTELPLSRVTPDPTRSLFTSKYLNKHVKIGNNRLLRSRFLCGSYCLLLIFTLNMFIAFYSRNGIFSAQNIEWNLKTFTCPKRLNWNVKSRMIGQMRHSINTFYKFPLKQFINSPE